MKHKALEATCLPGCVLVGRSPAVDMPMMLAKLQSPMSPRCWLLLDLALGGLMPTVEL